VVTKPVPAGGTAVGNPARVIVPAAATASAASAASVVKMAAAVSAAPADGGASTARNASAAERAASNGAARDGARDGENLAAERSGFCAYGITPNADDPVSLAIHGLIDHAATQAKRIDEIVVALERLGTSLEGLQGADAAMLDLRRLSAAIAGKMDGAVAQR
jgi:serine O-acetyltransferase